MKILLVALIMAAPSFAAQLQRAASMPQLSTIYSGNEIRVVQFELESSESQTPGRYRRESDREQRTKIENQKKIKELMRVTLDVATCHILEAAQETIFAAITGDSEEVQKYLDSLAADNLSAESDESVSSIDYSYDELGLSSD